MKKRLNANVLLLNVNKIKFFIFAVSPSLLPNIEQILIHDDNCPNTPNCSSTKYVHQNLK